MPENSTHSPANIPPSPSPIASPVSEPPSPSTTSNPTGINTNKFILLPHLRRGEILPLPPLLAKAVLITHHFPPLSFQLDRIGTLANGDCAIAAPLYSSTQHNERLSLPQVRERARTERLAIASHLRTRWTHGEWIAQVPISARQSVWSNSHNNSYSYLLQELRKGHEWLDPLVFHPIADKYNVGIFLLSVSAFCSPMDNRRLSLLSPDAPFTVSSYNVKPENRNNIILIQTSINTPVAGGGQHASQHYESILVDGAPMLDYDHHLIQSLLLQIEDQVDCLRNSTLNHSQLLSDNPPEEMEHCSARCSCRTGRPLNNNIYVTDRQYKYIQWPILYNC